MISYHKLRNTRGLRTEVFWEVCTNPDDWLRRCSPLKLNTHLNIRVATMIRSWRWWQDRGLKADTDRHSAMFVKERSEV